MKKESWNLFCGNRGFILSMDAALAVLIIIVIVVISIFFVNRPSDSASLQMSRSGYDIMALLRYDGTLASLNKNAIESGLEDLMPVNYDMKIIIECGSKVVETSKNLPNNKIISAGQSVIVTKDLDYCLAKHWIWLR